MLSVNYFKINTCCYDINYIEHNFQRNFFKFFSIEPCETRPMSADYYICTVYLKIECYQKTKCYKHIGGRVSLHISSII
jgi:threonine dehydratase